MALSEQQKKEILRPTNSKKHHKKSHFSRFREKYSTKLFPSLDHGFVRVVDYMGDDSSIVQAARVSYGKGTKKSFNR